jgi:glycosyltransferase involved in cell wall biosynthesis
VKQTFCWQGDCSNVVVVYDGIEFGIFESVRARASIRSELGIPADAPLIGEVGRVSEIKGYEDFVLAAAIVKKAVPDAAFIGVGGRTKPDADYEQKMLQLIDSENLQGSFRLIDFREDISDIMSALDLLVLPSRSEALGRVLIEAMAAGKPVIGTQIGGIPEVIEDGVTGLVVPPRSPDALAQAIIKILRDPNLAYRIGTAGREQGKVRFSLERHVAEVQRVYERLLGEIHSAYKDVK